MDSSLSEQTGWLLSTMSEHINGGDIPALAWSQQFLAALGTDSNTIKVLNQLLNLRQSSQSWKTLASGIFNVATQQGIGSWALSLAAQRVLPASVAQELETFYRASSRKESVNSMAQRAATSMFNIAKPFVVGALMGNPLAAVTVHYAETLQQCSSVEDMLKWFIAHDQSKNNTLHSVNGHYLNVMMLWQIHQAMNSTDIHETEAALNKLAGQLNKFDVVKHYPQLKKLIDLLPLLPALREASQTISIPLSANSLVDWSDQWLAALANSQSQNLKNLRVQLSLHVENWLADAVISGCEVLVQQPWGMISGANAAPADRSVPITTPNSLAPPEHNWETEINWSFMAPAIGLETIGLAAIGYALWKWRQPTLVKETVRRNPNSNSVYHTAQTVPLIQGISPERPGCASLWDQKVPLLLGIAAMAAGGGVMAYGGFNRLEKQVAASSKITEEEYKQELAIIQELDVPPLDFLTTDLEVAEPDFFSEMNSEVFIRSKKDTSFQRQRTPIGDIPSQISSIQEKVSDPLLKAEFIAYPNTRERGT